MEYLRIPGLIAALACIALLASTLFNTTSLEPRPATQSTQSGHDDHTALVSREEFEGKLSQIDLLHREVADLSRQISQLQKQNQPQSADSPENSAANNTFYEQKRVYSISDRFEYGDLSSQNTSSGNSNLEGAIYGSVTADIEVYSTECRGSLCKVYTSASDSGSFDTPSTDEFIDNINNSIDGNVNIYFDDEGGQPVIYVESIE
jgi:hypothetical protein